MSKKRSYSDDDTIAAIITPPGEGGLGAIRISGSKSTKIIQNIFRPADKKVGKMLPFRLYYGHITDESNNVIDEVTAVMMPEGKSYTGQKQVEIFCHGGQFVLKRILSDIFACGARPAEPGEFTKRAFLAGRIDLTKAEAVADLVASKTEYSYNAARRNLLGEMSQDIDIIRDSIVELLAEIEALIDFPEERLETAERDRQLGLLDNIIKSIEELMDTYRAGKIIREGYRIAISGRPNAGKSSLFNLLLNESRAIVAPVPGTTRDYLTEWIDMEGLAVSLSDTAGLREVSGTVEREGQRAAHKILAESDLIIWIADISKKTWRKSLELDLKKLASYKEITVILNKIDLIDTGRLRKMLDEYKAKEYRFLSCKTKKGYKLFRKKLAERINLSLPDLTDRLVITSERHQQKLLLSLKSLKKAGAGIRRDESPDLIAFEIRHAINAIDEITDILYWKICSVSRETSGF
jgi:tRNA modification GTPase